MATRAILFSVQVFLPEDIRYKNKLLELRLALENAVEETEATAKVSVEMIAVSGENGVPFTDRHSMSQFPHLAPPDWYAGLSLGY